MISNILKSMGIYNFRKGVSIDQLRCLYEYRNMDSGAGTLSSNAGTIFFIINDYHLPVVINSLSGYEDQLMELYISIDSDCVFPVEEIDLYFVRKKRNEKLEKLWEK